jgi:hypothetical protein
LFGADFAYRSALHDVGDVCCRHLVDDAVAKGSRVLLFVKVLEDLGGLFFDLAHEFCDVGAVVSYAFELAPWCVAHFAPTWFACEFDFADEHAYGSASDAHEGICLALEVNLFSKILVDAALDLLL